jgi:hypothetical protein
LQHDLKDATTDSIQNEIPTQVARQGTGVPSSTGRWRKIVTEQENEAVSKKKYGGGEKETWVVV